MVVYIPLSKTGKYVGKYETIVDDCDADLAEFNWSVMFRPDRATQYARRKGARPKRKTIFMHQTILERMLEEAGKPPLADNEFPDHINGNGLDNRRENLRVATRSQNIMNSRLRKDNVSGFKGVFWSTGQKRWIAVVQANGKPIYIGSYKTLELAVEAWKEKAREIHGAFWSDGNKA